MVTKKVRIVKYLFTHCYLCENDPNRGKSYENVILPLIYGLKIYSKNVINI